MSGSGRYVKKHLDDLQNRAHLAIDGSSNDLLCLALLDLELRMNNEAINVELPEHLDSVEPRYSSES